LAKTALKGFVSAGARQEIKITIRINDEFKGVSPYIFGNPHRTSVMREAGKIFVRGSIYRGFFDPVTLEGEIRQSLAAAPVYLFLRFIASVYLPSVGGFLMHSTSVSKDGRAFLFSGPPQSGKSTIARLCRKETVLSDDFSIIRKVNGAFCCFGSPFWGHVEAKGKNIGGRTQCVPVKGLYFLKQDDEVYARSLDKREAVVRLLQNISVLAKDALINKHIFGLADEFTDKIPTKILHFRVDDSFWRCLE